ncbi:hypothetical protein [Marinobacter salexigens]|uniref:hypothetical protein n=1 Tax=Marinobacter salexigens TaxID=1925763 RepID=UPI001374807C|nr:hypothetical protein [Marinobacter salexigens]
MPPAWSEEEVASAISGPVLSKQLLEHYLPWQDEILGRLPNTVPAFFLCMARSAHGPQARVEITVCLWCSLIPRKT